MPSLSPSRSMGLGLTLALGGAALGIAGAPPTPTLASCMEVPLVPPVTADDRLFIGSVVATDPSGNAVRVERWLAGPEETGIVVVQGRASTDPDVWSSIDWEPEVDASYLIAARPGERGILRTHTCRVSPLTPDVLSAVEQAYGPASSASPEPSAPSVTQTVADDTFRLTMVTDRATYLTTDAIPIVATLEMLRAEPTAVAGSGSGPVVFGVEQLDGPVDAGPAVTDDCVRDVWAPGEARVEPFSKSGGYDANDPMAGFWMTYFNDPDLILPAGRYRVFGVVDYDIDDCSVDASILSAEVRFEVVEPSVSPSPGIG